MHKINHFLDKFFDSSIHLFESGKQYRELGVLLGALRGLDMLHQSHHWQTTGTEYYADHLLFQKLYTKTNEEIDILAEKTVGVGDASLTNYFIQTRIIVEFLRMVNRNEPYVNESLRGERLFIECGELILKELERQGLKTEGVSQSVGNLLDTHEGHVYLLKQRCSE